MNEKKITYGIVKAVLILLALALCAFVLYKLRSLLIYAMIALVISLIGRPLVLFLKNKLRLTKILAVIITIFLFISVTVGVFSLFIPLLVTQSQNMSNLDLQALERNVTELQLEIEAYWGIKMSSFYDAISLETASKLQTFLGWSLNSFLSALGNLAFATFSTIFITFFFMKEDYLFDRMVLALFKDSKEERIKKSLDKIKRLLSRYFLGLFIQVSVLFILYYTILLIFGINNALTIALLSALLNLIPYIGPIIAGILMAAFSMTTYLGEDFRSIILPKTIWVLSCFLVTQILDMTISEPYIYSSSVRSHPLEIFLVIIAGGILFGIIGMMVAIPVYTMIKVVAKEFYNNNKVVKNLTKDI